MKGSNDREKERKKEVHFVISVGRRIFLHLPFCSGQVKRFQVGIFGRQGKRVRFGRTLDAFRPQRIQRRMSRDMLGTNKVKRECERAGLTMMRRRRNSPTTRPASVFVGGRRMSLSLGLISLTSTWLSFLSITTSLFTTQITVSRL